MKNYNSYQTLNNPNSSQCVSNMFPSSSQRVPNMILKFSWCSQYDPQVLMVFPIRSSSSHGVPNVILKFSWCSQYVPFKFSMGSPKFPMCSGTCSPYHLTFIPYALANVVLLVTYIAGPKESNFVLQNRTFYFGEPLEIF